jgi:hypothetical protein
MPEFIIHGLLFVALAVIGFKVTEMIQNRRSR